MRLVKHVLLIFCAFFLNLDNGLQATPIDLTVTSGGFAVSDPAFVSFGPDNNDAVLTEDDLWGLTWLSNDPFLGDPGIVVSLNASNLTFDLAFSTSGNDSFEVKLLDATGGAPLFSLFHDGDALGPGSFFYDNVSIDLVLLNLTGDTIGLDFSLVSGFTDLTVDAVLTIANVSINETLTPIPEPSTRLLVCLGMVAFIGYMRKETLHTKNTRDNRC